MSSSSKHGNLNEHAGYYSLAIIYAVFTLANFVAAPIVNILSAKWAMVLGGSLYAVFQVGFLFLNQTYLYITSATLGLGAALIWTGQGSYLSRNCTKETTGRNSALLWTLSQSCLVGGGIFLFLVFHQSKTTDNIANSTVKLLYAVFTGLSVIGIAILALLRAPPKRASDDLKIEYGKLMGSTFKVMFTKKMMLLAFVFAYTGIELSFMTGIYPTCISYTLQLGDNTNSLLALNAICEGAGQIVAGGTFGLLGPKTKKIGRDMIIFMCTIVHLIVFAGVYINFPKDASLKQTSDGGGLIEPQLWIALLCGFLLALGDAGWNTQIYSLIIDTYPESSAQAFALFKFYQSGLSCAAFFYGSVLDLQWHLAILVVFSMLAAVSFFAVEKMNNAKDSKVVPEKDGRLESEEFPPPPESVIRQSA